MKLRNEKQREREEKEGERSRLKSNICHFGIYKEQNVLLAD